LFFDDATLDYYNSSTILVIMDFNKVLRQHSKAKVVVMTPKSSKPKLKPATKKKVHKEKAEVVRVPRRPEEPRKLEFTLLERPDFPKEQCLTFDGSSDPLEALRSFRARFGIWPSRTFFIIDKSGGSQLVMVVPGTGKIDKEVYRNKTSN
jgi:hypothetical protein